MSPGTSNKVVPFLFQQLAHARQDVAGNVGQVLPGLHDVQVMVGAVLRTFTTGAILIASGRVPNTEIMFTIVLKSVNIYSVLRYVDDHHIFFWEANKVAVGRPI